MRIQKAEKEAIIRRSEIGVKRLRWRVWPYEDEPLWAHMRRLASLHGHARVSRFLKEYSPHISYSDIMSGFATQEIAQLAGLPVSVFDSATFQTKNHRVSLNKETLPRTAIATDDVRVCPCCLAEDYECLPGRRTFRPHYRTLWTVRAVNACPQHGVRLIAPGKDAAVFLPWTSAGERFGMDGARKPARIRDARLFVGEAAHTADVRLSAYIAARLGLGGQAEHVGILYAMPLAEVLKLCEAVGRLMPEFDSADVEDSAAAQRLGFIAFCEGRLETVLDGRVSEIVKGGQVPTPRQAYGRIYDIALDHRGDQAFEEFEELFVAHGLDRTAIAGRSTMFKPGLQTHLTISQAAREFNVTVAFVTEFVESLDRLFPDWPKTFNGKQRIINEQLRYALNRVVIERIDWDEARSILNVHESLFSELVSRGLVPRLMTFARAPVFLKSSLIRFRQGLEGASEEVEHVSRDQVLLLKVESAEPEIDVANVWARLLRPEDPLKAVAKLRVGQGAGKVVLSLSDLRRNADTAPRNVVNDGQLAHVLRSSRSTARDLVKKGLIRPDRQTRTARGRIASFEIFETTISAFQEHYISIRELNCRLLAPMESIRQKAKKIGGFGSGGRIEFLDRFVAEAAFGLPAAIDPRPTWKRAAPKASSRKPLTRPLL